MGVRGISYKARSVSWALQQNRALVAPVWDPVEDGRAEGTTFKNWGKQGGGVRCGNGNMGMGMGTARGGIV